MKLNFKILIALFLVSNCNYAQTNRVLYLIDSSIENCMEHPCNHLVLYQIENRYIELLNVNAYSDDFTYKGQLIIEDNSHYFLFSNYGNAAGVTKYFYIDKLTLIVYETDYFLEYEIPIYYSLNTNSLSISCVSFFTDDCGIIKERKVHQKDIVTDSKDELPENYSIVLALIVE